MGKARFEVSLEHFVVFQRVVQNQTVLVSVFGDVAHAVHAALTDRGVGDVLAQHRDLA